MYTQEVWAVLSSCANRDGLSARGSLVLKQMSHRTGIRGHLVPGRGSRGGELDLNKKIQLRRRNRNRNSPRRVSGCGGNS